MIPFERTIDEKKAFQIADKHLNDINVPYSLTQKGNTGNTWTCKLHSNDVFESLSSGHGKGRFAKTGAIFEALEHYYTSDNNIPNALKSYTKTQYILNNPIFSNSPFFKSMSPYPQTNIATRTYNDIQDPKKTVDIPIIFSNLFYSQNPYKKDTFPYAESNIIRYSSNNGTAIGTSKEESTLHALNELIERDSFSLFLCKHLLYTTPYSIKVITQNSLPSYLQDKITEISNLIQENIYLIYLENEFNHPCFLAITDNTTTKKYYGLGCSSNATHSIERCLSELMQAVELYIQEPEKAVTVSSWIESFKHIPKLYKVAQFNVLERKNDFIATSFNSIVSHSDTMSVSECLQLTIDTLISSGFSIYESCFSPSKNIHLTNIFIPDFENFQIILTGSAVIPGSRGLYYKKY